MGSSLEDENLTVLIGLVEKQLKTALLDISVAQAMMSQACALREEANDRVTRACEMLTKLNNALAQKLEDAKDEGEGPDW